MLSVAFGRRWGSNCDDRSSDQSLKQNGVVALHATTVAPTWVDCALPIESWSLLCYNQANAAFRKSWSIVSWDTAVENCVSQCCRSHSLLIKSPWVFNLPRFYEILSQEEVGITRTARKKRINIEKGFKEKENCTFRSSIRRSLRKLAAQ